jgi:putative ABC transport system substrate-binding protein
MRRREFITLLGGAAAAWPLAAHGQQADRVRRIGRLTNVPNGPTAQTRGKAFQQELEKLGWVEGRNISTKYRSAEGNAARLSVLATGLVRLNVDVIVTDATPATIAAKQATSVIPIVFVGAGDPVATGLVGNLARPGGNVTGLSNRNRDLAGKRVELLREIVPGLMRLGILTNVDNVSAVLEMQEVEAAAATLGLDTVRLEIRRVEEIAPALEGFKGSARAIYAVGDALTISNTVRTNIMALGTRLPMMNPSRQQFEAGGLIYYGIDGLDQYRRAAVYVDKILRGTKPRDIPVEQPTKFQLAVNLTTARALGLTVPPTLLAIADEVIE